MPRYIYEPDLCDDPFHLFTNLPVVWGMGYRPPCGVSYDHIAYGCGDNVRIIWRPRIVDMPGTEWLGVERTEQSMCSKIVAVVCQVLCRMKNACLTEVGKLLDTKMTS